MPVPDSSGPLKKLNEFLTRMDSGRLAMFMAIILLLLVVVYGFLILRQPKQEDLKFDVRIVSLLEGEGLEILYRPKPEPMEMTLNLGSEWAAELTVVEEADHVSVMTDKGHTGLVGERPIGLTSIRIARDIEAPEKDYPVVQYGTKAAVYDAGAFSVIRINGRDVAQETGVHDYRWVSANDLPNERPLELDHGFFMLLDRGFSNAEQLFLINSTNQIAERLTGVFGPAGSPLLYMLAAEGQAGTLRIEGDAVPGGIIFRLAGDAWKTDPEGSEQMILLTLAHELVHLWQLEQKGVSAAPDWLHEGSAEALGVENLYLSGLLEDVAYADAFESIQTECADAMKNGKIVKAPERGDYRTSYVCGAMLWAALSVQGEQMTISEVWQSWLGFVEGRAGGQTEENFLDFCEDWTGNGEFADAARNFLHMDYSGASGQQVIDDLFEAKL